MTAVYRECVRNSQYQTVDKGYTCAMTRYLVSIQVFQAQKDQLSWFYIKLAGYTLMVLVRFDDIMGDAEPSSRLDSLDQALALAGAVGITVPLAQLKGFEAAPPVAVLIAGAIYFASHMARKWTRQYKQARKNKR